MWAGLETPVLDFQRLLEEFYYIMMGFPHHHFLNVLLQACYFSEPFVWYEEPFVIEPERT